MFMFRFTHRGDWSKTFNFLRKAERIFKEAAFDKYGNIGVKALQSATPKETGATANAWYYDIENNGKQVSIIWKNSNEPNGFPVAVMLQFGHGTGTGGYVRGIDYINPAMRPVFEKIAEDLWREVTS